MASVNYTFPNASAGLDNVLTTLSSEVPVFVPMLLLFVWIVVFVGGFSAQRRRGQGDAALWSTLASLSVLLIAIMMSVVTGIIQLEVLSITMGLTLVCALWLFLGKGRSEI